MFRRKIIVYSLLSILIPASILRVVYSCLQNNRFSYSEYNHWNIQFFSCSNNCFPSFVHECSTSLKPPMDRHHLLCFYGYSCLSCLFRKHMNLRPLFIVLSAFHYSKIESADRTFHQFSWNGRHNLHLQWRKYFMFEIESRMNSKGYSHLF